MQKQESNENIHMIGKIFFCYSQISYYKINMV
jgi:hypothetical protein